MSAKHQFGGVVQKGQFRPDDAPSYAVRLSRLEGKRVRLSIVRPHSKSTQPQNAYYRATVLPTIAEWCGYDPRDMGDLTLVHEGLKRRVFGTELRNGLEIVKSHAEYDIEKFSTFLDLVLRWCAESGLYVPGPEDTA